MNSRKTKSNVGSKVPTNKELLESKLRKMVKSVLKEYTDADNHAKEISEFASEWADRCMTVIGNTVNDFISDDRRAGINHTSYDRSDLREKMITSLIAALQKEI